MTNAINSLTNAASLWTQSSQQASAGQASTQANFLETLMGNQTEQSSAPAAEPKADNNKARDLFREFAGQAMFGQALATMRKSIDKPAYFHGGRGEEVFQQQLDHKLVEEVTKKTAERFIDPLFAHQSLQTNFNAQA